MNEILLYSLLVGGVLLSGLLVFKLKDQLSASIKLLLSFSGAYLLAICFLHLVPELYTSDTALVGFFILMGFLLQLFLEFLSQGIEHGHVHVHGNKFPIGIFLSLCLHALLEGMPLENSLHQHGGTENHSLLYGVVLHKIPVSIVLMIMLLKIGMSKGKSLLFLLLFAAMAPLGAFLNHVGGENLNAAYPGYFSAVLAIVVGMLLHISTTILFEASEGHKFNVLKLVAIVTGGLVAYLTL